MESLDSYGGAFTKNFSKDSRMTIMLITAGATLICETIIYLIQIILFKQEINILLFLKIVLIEALFNVILIIILYPLIDKAGEVLTKTFNEKNILTKYYK